jgi:glutamate racemase
MQRAAIGVFDSGVGGLTVVRALRSLLPEETILYLGDTARVPYGNKSQETVQRYAIEALNFLEIAAAELVQRRRQMSFSNNESLGGCSERGLKMVVIACNTASAFALQELRQRCEIPVIGVIRAAVWRAIQVSKTRKIGVIGTEGTIRSGVYQKAIGSQDPGIEVIARACALLVPLVEEGWLQHPVTDLALDTYLGDLRTGLMDTLILGCTHYPLLRPALEQFFGEQVALIDSSDSVAQEVALLLQKRGWKAKSDKEGELICFVTDATERFQKVAARFLGGEPQRVEQIDLQHFISSIRG